MNTETGTKESLIYHGANGGLSEEDVRVICKHDPPRKIDISGITNHHVTNLEIRTAGAVVPSQ